MSRRSSSGLVLLFGRHCLKTSSSVQEPIGLSSGESEFYACVKGGAALLSVAILAQAILAQATPSRLVSSQVFCMLCHIGRFLPRHE